MPGDQLQSLFTDVPLTAGSAGLQQQESRNTEALVDPLAGSAGNYLAVSADSLSGNRPRWKKATSPKAVSPPKGSPHPMRGQRQGRKTWLLAYRERL